MKKFFSLCAMLLVAFATSAQNLQLHYDFGRHLYSDKEAGRQFLTATFEHFKADRLGHWYYFIDLDIDKEGMRGGYVEITREFNFYKTGEAGAFAAHIEYNGGLTRYSSFQQAGLLGVSWNGHSKDYSKTYSLQTLYKHFIGDKNNGSYASFQITGVWGLNFLKNKLTFSGFFDIWSEKTYWAGDRHIVFLTEPQLWYNFHNKVSVGTEIEVSSNFIYHSAPNRNDSWFVNPTLAFKYNF